jgi:hypothetical protein
MYMSLTAVRGADAGTVADVIQSFARRHGVDPPLERPPTGPDDEICNIDQLGGWTTVCWSRYFTARGSASERLSRELGTVVSAIDVFEGAGWNHLVFRGGVLLDRFSSYPDYYTDDREEAARLRRDWAGRPEVVADAFGVPVQDIAGYLLQPYSSPLFGWAARRDRVHPGDGSVLGDVWVFTDFWRRLGIRYPDPRLAFDESVALRFRKDSRDKLGRIDSPRFSL